MRGTSRWEAPLLTLHLFALALAVGPPIFFAFAVAPTEFRILPTRDMAAALTGPILTRACWLAEGSFLVLFVTGWFLSGFWEAPRLARSLLTRAAVFGMIASLVIEKLLIQRMEKVREEAGGPIDNLPAGDPLRILLDRYHRLATTFFAADLAAAILVLLVTARLIVRRAEIPRAPAAARPPIPKLLDLSDV